MLNAHMKARQTAGRRDEEYEKASWPYLQADINGYTKAIDYVISLIK
jgi:hypothetical protein